MDDGVFFHHADDFLKRAHRDDDMEVAAAFVVDLFFHHGQAERVSAHNGEVVAADFKEQAGENWAQVFLAGSKGSLAHQIRQGHLRNAHAMKDVHFWWLWKFIAWPADHFGFVFFIMNGHFILTIIGCVFK